MIYLVIYDFVIESSITIAELSWKSIPNTAIDIHFYEVGLLITSGDQDCSSSVNQTVLSVGNLSYIISTNTTTAVVTNLEADTCYVFGVRVYSTRKGQPGEWTIRVNSTLAESMKCCSRSIHE